MYLVRWAGVDPSDGSPMWYDRNGNITKSYSDNNRVVLKDKRVSPMLYGGLNNILSYRNWTLAFNITYSIGGWGAPTYLNRFLSDGYDITGGNQAVSTMTDGKPRDRLQLYLRCHRSARNQVCIRHGSCTTRHISTCHPHH